MITPLPIDAVVVRAIARRAGLATVHRSRRVVLHGGESGTVPVQVMADVVRLLSRGVVMIARGARAEEVHMLHHHRLLDESAPYSECGIEIVIGKMLEIRHHRHGPQGYQVGVAGHAREALLVGSIRSRRNILDFQSLLRNVGGGRRRDNRQRQSENARGESKADERTSRRKELTFGCPEFEKESDPWLASEKRLAR